MMLILCMGLAFELPLVTWLLSLLGIVNKSFLRKYRRHAVVVIVIAIKNMNVPIVRAFRTPLRSLG